MTLTFLRRFKIVFTPKSSTYQSGMVFKLMVSERSSHGSRLEDVTHVSSVSDNGSVQTWINITDFWSTSELNTFKIYAFATSDGGSKVEYV